MWHLERTDGLSGLQGCFLALSAAQGRLLHTGVLGLKEQNSQVFEIDTRMLTPVYGFYPVEHPSTPDPLPELDLASLESPLLFLGSVEKEY